VVLQIGLVMSFSFCADPIIKENVVLAVGYESGDVYFYDIRQEAQAETVLDFTSCLSLFSEPGNLS
jgi:hypothetical protein